MLLHLRWARNDASVPAEQVIMNFRGVVLSLERRRHGRRGNTGPTDLVAGEIVDPEYHQTTHFFERWTVSST